MPSQRHLSRKLDVSLGLVNSFVKRLAQKGYFKVTHIPKNRVKYILTPKGAAEKTRLTYEYIRLSFTFYKNARRKIRLLFNKLERDGVQRLAFYGVSDLAEIAYLSLLETNIELAAVVDAKNATERFIGYKVSPPNLLPTLYFDKILITATDAVAEIEKVIIAQGVHRAKILKLE